MPPADNHTLREEMEGTLRRFFDNYVDAFANNDPGLISTTLDPSCLRKLTPASFLKEIGAPPDFARDVAAYQAEYNKTFSVAHTKSVQILHLTIDTEARTAAADTVFAGEFIDGEIYSLEFAWFLEFSGDGTKITNIVEWVDSFETIKIYRKVEEMLAKKAAE